MTNKELQNIFAKFPDDLEIVKRKTIDDGRYVNTFYDIADVDVRLVKNAERYGKKEDGLVINVKYKK